MQTEALNNWTVATDDESQWLVTLGELWQARTQAGWQFCRTLRDGVDKFSKRRDKAELYELVANQTGLSTKTLMNLVSIARNENSELAEELGLDIAHADAVRSLFYDEAQALLTQAAEQSLTADAVKAIIRERRQATTSNAGTSSPSIPDAGNEPEARHYVSAEPDDVPFAGGSNVLYDDVDARAEHYAGSSSGYDWQDEDDDTLLLSRNEARDVIEAAWRRLPQDDTQRSVREWLMLLERNAY